MLALQIDNLSQYYGELKALDNIHFDIKTGESFGLIGLNGAGKTSLIKSILDLQTVSVGSIKIFGDDSHNKQARNKLSYLPEKFLPPDYMTGLEYLKFIVNAYNQSKALDLAYIEALCSKLDLNKTALKKSVNTFSKGMMQKLGIMGCLLSDRELLVMDEPMSGLDPKARSLFSQLTIELKEQNKTLLLCTHILNDIERLCDKVGILHEGQLRYIGSPEACCQQFKEDNLEAAFLNCIENNI